MCIFMLPRILCIRRSEVSQTSKEAAECSMSSQPCAVYAFAKPSMARTKKGISRTGGSTLTMPFWLAVPRLPGDRNRIRGAYHDHTGAAVGAAGMVGEPKFVAAAAGVQHPLRIQAEQVRVVVPIVGFAPAPSSTLFLPNPRIPQADTSFEKCNLSTWAARSTSARRCK